MKTKHPSSSQRTRHRLIRWIGLTIITLGMALVAYFHQHPLAGWTPPGVDALCPFGGLEAAWSFLTSGDMLTKIAASSFILFVAVLGLTLIFRRAFCGQLCPLGALQGAAAGLGKRLHHRKFQLPKAIDRPLRGLKYLVLAVVTGLTWIAGSLIIRPYDPWVAFMHLSSTELWTGFAVGASILFLSLLASVFFDRFFCKYLCPMGAFYGIIAKLGLFRVRREESLCLHCGRCDQVCPVDLPVASQRDQTSAECLACGLCVTSCPAPGALSIAGPGRVKISPLGLTLISVALIGAVIAATTLLGWFEISQKSLAASLPSATVQAAGAPTSSSPAFDPDLIKGRNSFTEVANLTGIPASAFLERFQLQAPDLAQPIKDAVANYGSFTTADVRNFVAQKLGLQGYQSLEK